MTQNRDADDYDVQSYQDDIDLKGTDIITHELTDDPVEIFGVPAKEFKKELDHLDGETRGDENREFEEEDMREHIQDLNEGDIHEPN